MKLPALLSHRKFSKFLRAEPPGPKILGSINFSQTGWRRQLDGQIGPDPKLIAIGAVWNMSGHSYFIQTKLNWIMLNGHPRRFFVLFVSYREISITNGRILIILWSWHVRMTWTIHMNDIIRSFYITWCRVGLVLIIFWCPSQYTGCTLWRYFNLLNNWNLKINIISCKSVRD